MNISHFRLARSDSLDGDFFLLGVLGNYRNLPQRLVFRIDLVPHQLGKTTMKAILQEKYGSPDLLELRDIDKPVVSDDAVLVRVRAVGLHVGDCFAARGAPFAIRMVTGLFKPKSGVPGFDVAGQVEAVGRLARFTTNLNTRA